MHVPKVINKLVELLSIAESENVRLSAASDILDRDGRKVIDISEITSKSEVEISNPLQDLSTEELKKLVDKDG